MSASDHDEDVNEEERAAQSFFDRFACIVDDAADALAQNDALIGQTIGHYRVDARIGEGGMGVVYRALDTRLNRTVALKFMPDHLNADRRAKERFLIEARAAAALDDPNICSIFEVGETETQRVFLALAFYEGETLDARLKNGPLPLQKVLDYATQIARGLGAAHERGIVHRDVKPSNVIVTANGVVKLLDFGIARMADVTGVTATGVTLGTMAYMSPEQATGRPVDGRTDLWSLGVLLYEMCTGERPFGGRSATALLHAILNDRPAAASKSNPELPRQIDNIIARLLEKDTAARYADARDVIADLARVPTITPKTVPAKQRRMRTALLSLTLLAIVALIWAFFPRRESLDSPALAVLPLESLSNGPGDQDFAEAMHDQLVTEIGTIRSIFVFDRAGVRQYRESPLSLPRIASELNVTHLLTGSAALDGDSVRIVVRLYDREGKRVWEQSYWEPRTNVLRLQADISRRVAKEIRAAITPGELNRMTDDRVISASAFALYSEGLGLFERGGPFREGVTSDTARRLLDLAAERFLAATRADSSWARPWAYLARTRHWQATSVFDLPNWKPRSDSLYRLSEQAALRAIDLDSTEADAWTALGYVRRRWKWDWISSKAAYETALRQNANAGEAKWGLALFDETNGDLEPAIAGLRSAMARNPRSRVLRLQLGNALICANRVDEGLDTLVFRDGPPIESWERFSRANALLLGKRYNQAIQEFRRRLQPGEIPPANLAFAYYKAGDTNRARQIVNERKRALDPTGEMPNWGTPADHLAIGDTTALLATLAAMIQSKTLSPTVRCDAYFDDLIAVAGVRAMLENGMKLQF